MNRTAQYLAVVYRLSREEGEPVPSGRIAETLDRSPAATTEMIQRLESEGLVEHEPYEGVRLTASGRERAAERYRTYETLRVFFRDVLELDAYEREAFELVGAVSPTVAERLEETILTTDGSESSVDVGGRNE